MENPQIYVYNFPYFGEIFLLMRLAEADFIHGVWHSKRYPLQMRVYTKANINSNTHANRFQMYIFILYSDNGYSWIIAKRISIYLLRFCWFKNIASGVGAMLHYMYELLRAWSFFPSLFALCRECVYWECGWSVDTVEKCAIRIDDHKHIAMW